MPHKKLRELRKALEALRREEALWERSIQAI